MLDLETLWRIIDEGSTPVIAVIAFFLWKVERAFVIFVREFKASQKARNKQMDELHEDVKRVIRRLAGVEE